MIDTQASIQLHRAPLSLSAEQRSYEWHGPENGVAWVDVWDLPPTYRRLNPGDTFSIGGLKVRILEYHPEMDRYYVVRDKGTVTALQYQAFRLLWRLDHIYRKAVLTAAVWGLATYKPHTVPHWRDVYLLDRLAKWWSRDD